MFDPPRLTHRSPKQLLGSRTMPRQTFMSFPSVRARQAVAALAFAVLLCGCQGSSTPGSPASPTGTTTATPTSSASSPIALPGSATTETAPALYKPADAKGKAQNVPVPVMPDLAKENSKAGLEAFIGYWYAQQNYAAETGDQSMWSQLSAPECQTCKRIEKGISDSHIHGRWSVGGSISIPAIESLWLDGARNQQAKVQVIQEQIDYFNADGTPGRASEAATNSAFGLFATYGSAGWTVTNLGIIN
ncbi:DUF6318 family protein [Paenarthrobacter sp. TYUT067]|uniref:DUF6318 family protein n=1 Tax=Paenarthrobacter sp. TYUT067 TaxID=2926245 RepID=UPI0027E0323E|nr:DUF6318 family protein [Paenarthrobacter sp. TYUT067]